MPKTADKAIKVTINIQPGLASSVQKTAWRKFWQKLIAEVSTMDSFQSRNKFRRSHEDEPTLES